MLCEKIQNEIKKLNNDNNNYQQCVEDGTVPDSTFSDSSQKPLTIWRFIKKTFGLFRKINMLIEI